jgi:hypothetical protein
MAAEVPVRNPIFPNSTESLVVTFSNYKTAALAFDRVYRVPVLDDPVPEEIGFFCGTESEVYLIAQIFLLSGLDEAGFPYKHKEYMQKLRAGEDRELRRLGERKSMRTLCSDIKAIYGIAPAILYSEPNARNEEFQNGKFDVLTSSISNIAMVNEKELSWEQVMEFRKDAETRAKYCRFVRWVDLELKTKSPKEGEDLIAIRLDDYKWALKKHGLKTTIGTLSCLLDPKFPKRRLSVSAYFDNLSSSSNASSAPSSFNISRICSLLNFILDAYLKFFFASSSI